MVYLAYSGMQDIFLTEKPDFTHFKTIYSRDMQLVSRKIVKPFDKTQAYKPGETLISTIRRDGDYIMGITLTFVVSKLTGTPNGLNWPYTPVIGDFVYGFNSSGTQIFTILLNSRAVSTVTTDWYSVTGDVSLSISSSKFTFTSTELVDYLIFSNYETARLFGFVYSAIQLFGGYLKFDTNSSTPKSQITCQESGWIDRYDTTTAYIDDISYKLINTVGLYIGKQLIQEFDSTFIKIKKEITTSYKNRPVLKLLEGDTNVVDFKRQYYFEIPFIDIPVYAIPMHDIQVVLSTNPLTDITIDGASLVVNNHFFSNVDKLPKTHIIPVRQMYYSTRNKCDIRGPVNTMFTLGDPSYTFSLNGEKLCDSDTSNVAAFENFTNMPLSSNAIVFDGPINMSRIRDQNFKSSNTVVYAETTNILVIENNLAGLMFDYTDTRDAFPKLSLNALVPQPPPDPPVLYLFDNIPNTATAVVSMYSMRRVNILYEGPIIRLVNSDGEEANFYTDANQTYLRTLDGIDYDTWAGTATSRVNRWYDQSGNGNFFYEAVQAPKLTKQNDKYVLFFDNPSTTFTTTLYSMLSTSSIFTNQISLIHKPAMLSQNQGIILNAGASLTYTTSSKIDSNPSMTKYSNNILNGDVPVNAWSTFTGYSASQIGPIDILCNTKQSIVIDVYSGYIFELGFFGGTTFSGAERTEYFNESPF